MLTLIRFLLVAIALVVMADCSLYVVMQSEAKIWSAP